MNVQFGLLFTKFTGDEPQKCSDPNCPRLIMPDSTCVVDIQTGDTMCDGCGKSERYARKCAELRGNKEVPLIKGLDY